MPSELETPIELVGSRFWCHDCGITLSLSASPTICPVREKWLCDGCGEKNDHAIVERRRRVWIRELESKIYRLDSEIDDLEECRDELYEELERLKKI